MSQGRSIRTPANREKFLTALSEGASITSAAKACGSLRQTFYRWRSEDPAFAAEWDEAIEAGTDLLEDEARRRAVDGVEKPIFYQGREVGRMREYSDSLLMFLLKGRRPDKFRDGVPQNQHELTINVRGGLPD